MPRIITSSHEQLCAARILVIWDRPDNIQARYRYSHGFTRMHRFAQIIFHANSQNCTKMHVIAHYTELHTIIQICTGTRFELHMIAHGIRFELHSLSLGIEYAVTVLHITSIGMDYAVTVLHMCSPEWALQNCNKVYISARACTV